jgi:hypothetical protein
MAGGLPIQKQTMEKQEEKQTSVEYLLDIIKDLLNDKYPYDLSILREISINARAKYKKELDEAYKEAMKYRYLLTHDGKLPF